LTAINVVIIQSNKRVYYNHHQHFQLSQINEQGGKGIVQDEVSEVRVDGDAYHLDDAVGELSDIA
jgi:hypothetical protein